MGLTKPMLDPLSIVTDKDELLKLTSKPTYVSCKIFHENLGAINTKMKVKSDHHSKNQGFNGIRTRDLRDTGAMLYQLSDDHSSLSSTTAVQI